MDKKKGFSGNVFDAQVLGRVMQFVKPYRVKFGILIFLTFFLAVSSTLRPLLIMYTIDSKIAGGDMPGFMQMVIVLLGLLLLQAFGEYFHTYISSVLGQNVIKDMRVKLYRHLINFRLKFYDNTPIGRLVTRTVSDIEAISDIFSEGIAGIISDVLQLLLIVGIMLFVSWKVTLVSLSLLPLLLFSTYVFKESIKASFNEVRNAVASLNTFVQEHITGMNIVQIFNAEERELYKFKEINKEHREANIKSIWAYSIYFPISEVISSACIGLLVWYGAGEMLHEHLKNGELVALIMFINMFFRPIRMIADRFNTLQMGLLSADRVLKLIDEKDEFQKDGTMSIEHLEGYVRFDNVSFGYLEDQLVLKNISFELQPGEVVALVGATGAGKSSIINLLTRLYEINSGAILLDGVDNREVELASLRRHIGVVLQDVFLFSDTIYENITLGKKDITLDMVKQAAALVGADKFIENLPGGYQYNVKERGASLSVGQRQLISFIRAMVYNPKILVLDEATSSVDHQTEEMIQKALENMTRGRTSIVIAHRLSTIQNADKIIVLDKGEIKETGTHEELMALQGFYSILNQMQFKTISG